MDAVHAHLPRPHDPFVDLVPPQGIKLTPRHYAYLKIAEGCNHRCTFCIIPSMRGDLVSRPVGEVLQEAENLVKAGVKELLVISQDTSAYGVDVKYRTGFWRGRPVKTRMTQLASHLAELGVWVRLHYVYPYPHVDEVVPLMAAGRAAALPRRAVSAREPAHPQADEASGRQREHACTHSHVARDLPRHHHPQHFHRRLSRRDGSGVRASLLAFLEEAQLDRVGCFAYSPVDGAAANALPDPVPEEVKQERRARFMQLQARISADKLQRKIGQTLTVLVDEVGAQGAVARSTADAPEIDGLVYIADAHGLKPGEFTRVTVHRADEHDLHATLA